MLYTLNLCGDGCQLYPSKTGRKERTHVLPISLPYMRSIPSYGWLSSWFQNGFWKQQGKTIFAQVGRVTEKDQFIDSRNPSNPLPLCHSLLFFPLLFSFSLIFCHLFSPSFLFPSLLPCFLPSFFPSSFFFFFLFLILFSITIYWVFIIGLSLS